MCVRQAAFEEMGYDDARFLVRLTRTQEGRQLLTAHVRLKPGHLARLEMVLEQHA